MRLVVLVASLVFRAELLSFDPEFIRVLDARFVDSTFALVGFCTTVLEFEPFKSTIMTTAMIITISDTVDFIFHTFFYLNF